MITEDEIVRTGLVIANLIRFEEITSPGCQSADEDQSASLLPTAIFAKRKTKKAEKQNHHHVIKPTKEVNMQHLILLGVLSGMFVYVLISAGCLCYVARHGRRTS